MNSIPPVTFAIPDLQTGLEFISRISLADPQQAAIDLNRLLDSLLFQVDPLDPDRGTDPGDRAIDGNDTMYGGVGADLQPRPALRRLDEPGPVQIEPAGAPGEVMQRAQGEPTQALEALPSDVGFEVCTMAVQVFGGYGYMKDYPVEKFYRDAKIGTIYEGTSNMQLSTIAKGLLKG